MATTFSDNQAQPLTLESLCEAMDMVQCNTGQSIYQIKVDQANMDYLKTEFSFKRMRTDDNLGVISHYCGIPIILDRTIDGYEIIESIPTGRTYDFDQLGEVAET